MTGDLMAHKVLLTSRSFRQHSGEHKRILRAAGCELVESSNNRPLTATEMLPLVADVDAVIVGLDQVSAEVIAAGRRLRVISKCGSGLDHIDLQAATRHGVVVTSTPGANAVSVAELTLGLMLALARRIPQHNHGVKDGSWKRVVGVELASKTLGIIGLGRVGLAVARRARGLDMNILYCDVDRHKDLEVEYGLVYAELGLLLRDSDFVTLHCPLTPDLHNLIGEAQLRAMKSTAFLINTARGGLVDEAALTRALREDWIAGAASDAFVHEPPLGSPLLALDNFRHPARGRSHARGDSARSHDGCRQYSPGTAGAAATRCGESRNLLSIAGGAESSAQHQRDLTNRRFCATI
jgi:D-3-phosphoglycerate dehydrogenase